MRSLFLCSTLVAFAALPGACRRIEEPETSAPADPEPLRAASAASTSAASTSAANTSARCIVRTPRAAQPKAEKAAHCPPDPGPRPALEKATMTFVDAPSAPRVEVELARDTAHQARGLMYRTHMPADQGMLFSYPEERELSFWMKNTCIPLDMLFLAADGTIVGILEEVPVLNLTPRSVDCPAAHVLELNAGYCRRHGIEAGMRVTLP